MSLAGVTRENHTDGWLRSGSLPEAMPMSIDWGSRWNKKRKKKGIRVLMSLLFYIHQEGKDSLFTYSYWNALPKLPVQVSMD